MGTFDPNSFLDVTIDVPLERRPPIPVGDYVGIFGDPVTTPWVSSKDSTKSGYRVDIPVEIDVPPDVVEKLNLRSSTLKLKHSVMLDLTPNGGIDQSQGANSGLRLLREALGMNKAGEPFAIRKVTGRAAKFKIGHREYPEGSGELFEDIKGLAKA